MQDTEIQKVQQKRGVPTTSHRTEEFMQYMEKTALRGPSRIVIFNMYPVDLNIDHRRWSKIL